MDSIDRRDIHVLKYFSSFVSVSEGRVIYVSDPKIHYCPLASHFYKDLRNAKPDKEELKQAIRKTIEFKIKEYGFFTPNRNFHIHEIQVPYGASEMLMFALRSRVIEAAVIVCDGAGTVISNSPEIVQGIGARMHNLIMTSPIVETIRHLVSFKCHLVSNNAIIDQVQGVRKAAEMGYKVIAVTIDGNSVGNLERLKDIEKHYGVKIISLVVCTAGIDKETAEKIIQYVDLVWSCSSVEVRKGIGPFARLQLSESMPVFIMSESGVGFASGYCADCSDFVSSIDKKKRYLISSRKHGKRISIGNFSAYIEESQLPVLSPEFSVYSGVEDGLAIA
jgi:putative methanogenesis marker protein 8